MTSDKNPSNKPEFTLRAVLVGILVAMLVGASFPYIVLKMGFGITISVVSAFLGYMILTFVSWVALAFSSKARRSNRFEFNLVQTAGTSASQAGFMCVILAAFDMLAAKPELGFNLQPSALQVFLWLSVAGCLGVLLAVPLRKHYIDEENLPFPDGTAAGETLLVLDQAGSDAKSRLKVLTWAGIFGAVTTWLRDASRLIPESTFFGSRMAPLNVGWHWSALSFGSGFIVGLRIALSMLLGSLFAFVLMPFVLSDLKIVEWSYRSVLKWVMWPATGLMVAGGLTALALRWKTVLRSFSDLKVNRADSSDLSMKTVLWGSGILAVVLIALQKWSMNISVFHSVIALAVSLPLMLVGTRVLGETNWAPVSAMANMVQALFAVVAPGSVAVNMVASGMSGTVAANGEHLMQDYKAGKIVGSNNRYLTWMQLIATPIGALTVAWVYPILRRTYGIGAEKFGADPSLTSPDTPGLSSPISVKWAGFAELLVQGLDALPKYSLHALAVAAVLGVVLTVLEPKYKQVLPSPTGLALGMLIPAIHIFPMVAGALVQYVWKRKSPQTEESLSTPLASGLIVGEALLALVIPLLTFFGILSVAQGGGH